MSAQKEIQVWNDAVETCISAAWGEVIAIERERGDGLPDPSRMLIRAIGGLIKQGDDRRVIHGISADVFPKPYQR